MLYEELINITNLLEGNEYYEGGVSYYLGIMKMGIDLPLELAIKSVLPEIEESGSELISITEPRIEIENLCKKWHLEPFIYNKMCGLIDDNTKLYKFCDDSEYVSQGVISEVFRIMQKGRERVLLDFYVVD